MEHADSNPFQRRRVRVAAENQPKIEGDVHVTHGQNLATFLDSRRFFLSLTRANAGDGELAHVALRIDSVLWVASLDAALPLGAPQPNVEAGRPAELVLTDGARLHVELRIADEQRLTDYIDVPPFFVPVHDVRDMATNERLGDLALNTRRIFSIRELVEEPRQSRRQTW